MTQFDRDFIKTLRERLGEPHPLMQFVVGPRQVGKTTGLESFLKTYRKGSYIYQLAEGEINAGSSWLRLQWQKAQALGKNKLLVIDEIQKVDNWAEILKSLWDLSIKEKQNLKCIFLGSSSLKIQKGLTESLAGRFETIQVYHWNYLESKKIAPALTFSEYCKFGGYPKSYQFLTQPKRFHDYITNSIVKMVIENDILLNHTVKKPALFKQLTEVLAAYPAKEISYNKILGHIQESGNVEIVKYYLSLLEASFLFRPIHKYSGQKSKLSTPKILSMSQAISYALCPVELDHGYLFENLVGAELCKHVEELFYWREGDYEVDFIVRLRKKLIAIEVKSGRTKHSQSLNVFNKRYPEIPVMIIDHDEYLRLCREKVDFFLR